MSLRGMFITRGINKGQGGFDDELVWIMRSLGTTMFFRRW